jgi:predicted ATP pyrophosphatase (TIGR00289 family)
MGFPLVSRKVSGVKEKEVAELERVLGKLDVDGVVSGAVASEYQKTRIDLVCHNLGFKSFAPLWHKKPAQLLSGILYAGFKVMVVSVSAQGLGEEWLGKLLTGDDVPRLQGLEREYGVNPCGEGGEFETLVLDGPLFERRLVVKEFRKKWLTQAGFLEVVKAELQ